MYIVTLQTPTTKRTAGRLFFQRGTTHAFHADRATVYPTREAAEEAVHEAERFMHRSLRGRSRIIDISQGPAVDNSDAKRGL